MVSLVGTTTLEKNNSDQKKFDYGFELNLNVINSIPYFVSSGATHFQVTIPNAISPDKILELTKSISVIFHSNLLNVLGENNWRYLEIIAEQIKLVPALHIVEHFNQFVCEKSFKHAVKFEKNSNNIAIKNIVRWGNLLRKKICLENTPITDNVMEYFESLIDVARETNSSITCDVPHFLISCYSAGFNDDQIIELAKRINPIQIHLAGISITGNKICDNHKTVTDWIVSEAKRLFPKVKFITLEQAPIISEKNALILFKKCLSAESLKPPQDLNLLTGLNSNQFTESLANSNSEILKYCSYSRALYAPAQDDVSTLIVYDYFTPFFSPLNSIVESSKSLDNDKIITAIATYVKKAMLENHWWDSTNTAYAEIALGKTNEELFRINALNNSPCDPNLNLVKIRFKIKDDIWVEIAAPKINQNLAAKMEHTS
jgi:uncharacterized protein (UPF0276 family)